MPRVSPRCTVGSRFQYAAVLPGLQGVTPAPHAAPPCPLRRPGGCTGDRRVDPTAVLPGYQIDPGIDISNPDCRQRQRRPDQPFRVDDRRATRPSPTPTWTA